MLNNKRSISLRGLSVAAIIVTLLLSPLYLDGRPGSSHDSSSTVFPSALERVAGDSDFNAISWEEGGAQYLNLVGSFITNTEEVLGHEITADEALIVDQINITGGPFNIASEARGILIIGNGLDRAHYFSYTPNESKVYELAHPLTLSEGEQITFVGYDSSTELQSLVIAFIGRPLPPSGLTVK